MKKCLVTYLFIVITMVSFAQISTPSTPPSFVNTLITPIPIYKLPMVKEADLRVEDALEQQQSKTVPLRFGKDFLVQLNLSNSGVWETLSNNDRIWRLKIEAKNAKSLNFIFNDFYMPEGGKFFIYNTEKSYVIGAFTALNNKPHRKFSTAPVKGSTVILEYYEPQNVKNQGRLEVSSIIHAYRDMFATADDYIQSLDKSFGSSGNCNVDVNCAAGTNWQDEKRSVAMILTDGNTRWCSGAMVNNTAQDTTPYFLTADHCADGNEATWIFIFDYESPTCGGGDGNLTKSISGSSIRAVYAHTDMLLLELSNKPPDNYLVYYAGWDYSGLPSTTSAAIHHPSGDVKKISIDANSSVNGQNYNTEHWRIQNWEVGTTEGGSSGSPLFDQNHRIIGQLHGGLAACNNNSYDEFGKFSDSWLGGGTNASQLKPWLNPTNSSNLTLDGQYFVSASFTDNIKVDSIFGLRSCGQIQTPMIAVTNLGSEAITSMNITYQYDGAAPQTLQWTGNLTWLQSSYIALPEVQLSLGSYNLTVSLTVPNKTDEDVIDNFSNINFSILNNNSDLKIKLQTDSYPEEISYQLINSSGGVIFQIFSSQITGFEFENILITNELCLPNDCYKAVINDNFGDGLGGSSAYFSITTNTTQLGIINGNFGSTDTISFCLPHIVSTNAVQLPIINVEIFPNPTSDWLQFESEKMPNEILITNILGKRVGALQPILSRQLDLSYLENGFYFVQFRFDNQWIVKKVLVIK